jgi:hypothetical protein
MLNIKDLVTKINGKKEENVTDCKIISFCGGIKIYKPEVCRPETSG